MTAGNPRHFLDLTDFSGDDLRGLLDRSAAIKSRNCEPEVLWPPRVVVVQEGDVTRFGQADADVVHDPKHLGIPGQTDHVNPVVGRQSLNLTSPVVNNDDDEVLKGLRQN